MDVNQLKSIRLTSPVSVKTTRQSLFLQVVFTHNVSRRYIANLFFYIIIGGVVLEHDENDRLIAKPYNLNEVNKQKVIDEEQAPKQPLVTASMLA